MSEEHLLYRKHQVVERSNLVMLEAPENARHEEKTFDSAKQKCRPKTDAYSEHGSTINQRKLRPKEAEERALHQRSTANS